MSVFRRAASVDYAAIEAQRKREAEREEAQAKEEAFQTSLSRARTQRGRASTILTGAETQGAKKGTLG